MKDCCEILGLSRSSYYRKATANGRYVGDEALRRGIKAIVDKLPIYGSRRVRAQLALAPYEMRVGRNRVRRTMAEMGLQVRTKRSRSRSAGKSGACPYTNLVKGKQATRPDEIWVADITQIKVGSKQAHIAIVLDTFTRRICGWQLSRSAGQQLTLDALQKALCRYGPPEIHHSDRGGQYMAKDYVQAVQAAGARITVTGAGKPSENGYAERMMRTIKEEEVKRSDYRTLEEARRELGHFIDEFYARERLHAALDYRTPAGFEAEWRQNTP